MGRASMRVVCGLTERGANAQGQRILQSVAKDRGWSRFQYRSLTAGHVVDVGGEDVGEGGLAGEERKVAVDEVVVEVGVETPEVDIRQDRVVVGVVEIDESAHVVSRMT